MINYDLLFKNLQLSFNSAISVEQNDLEKASKILSDAGIKNEIENVNIMNAIGILNENGYDKQKLMQRIPEEKRNDISLLQLICALTYEIQRLGINNSDLNMDFDKALDLSKIYNKYIEDNMEVE